VVTGRLCQGTSTGAISSIPAAKQRCPGCWAGLGLDEFMNACVQPGDAAAYRIAVTRLDQESAEVLSEMAEAALVATVEGQRFKAAVDDHWRYSRAATVASGSIEMQRILLARSLMAAS